jgi:hypothetical protein
MNLKTYIVDTTKVDISYDHEFEKMPALKWWPWIGMEFKKAKNKTLILGESTYIWKAKSTNENERKEEEAWIRGRISRNDHLRILHQNLVLKFDRDTKYARNVERAIFQSKTPSNVDKDKLWASVVYHNLVLRHMSTIKERPTPADYAGGWKEMLNLAMLLEIDQCIVYGLERKKIDALLSILKPHTERGELTFQPQKISKSSPIVITIKTNGRLLKILFIRHPSSFFSWKKWGAVIAAEILSPIATC